MINEHLKNYSDDKSLTVKAHALFSSRYFYILERSEIFNSIFMQFESRVMIDLNMIKGENRYERDIDYDLILSGIHDSKECNDIELIQFAEQNRGGTIVAFNEYLTIFSVYYCKCFMLPLNPFSVNLLTIATFLLTGNRMAAKSMFSQLFIHIYTNHLSKYISKITGVQGGRPTHKRMGEALHMAMVIWEKNPVLTLERVAATVDGNLRKKYNDPPSISVLKARLRNAAFYPRKSGRGFADHDELELFIKRVFNDIDSMKEFLPNKT
ncbi:hypothetical protein QVN83_13625 [Yersinia frederiksenii]|uniref:hypothetical protein n=1 Tax=Yersinia frederiksenii TaxID=29484 RepID=UPI0025AB53CF|nr:hypothetical protein [Yersinia frederiksenii]MDN0120010.1 hypothetical protein [Yersinia frederiksenii]